MSAFQLIPQVFSKVKVRVLAYFHYFHTSSLFAQGHRHTETGLGFLVPATDIIGIIYICLLPFLGLCWSDGQMSTYFWPFTVFLNDLYCGMFAVYQKHDMNSLNMPYGFFCPLQYLTGL